MALTQLFVHPLKSCRGNAPHQAEVTPQGLRDDRVWLTSRADGQFISHPDYPGVSTLTFILPCGLCIYRFRLAEPWAHPGAPIIAPIGYVLTT